MTQEDLPHYLLINRSLLSLCEIKKRDLFTHALVKFAEMELFLNNLETETPSEVLTNQAMQIEKATAILAQHQKDLEFQQMILKKKLDQLQNSYQQNCQLLQFVAHLEENNDNDLFGFKINYNAIGNSTNDVVPLFNGNIAETYWVTKNDNILRNYGYQYDQLNRLNLAIYQKATNGTSLLTTNSYNEEIEYDKNGNITHLNRNGFFDYDNGVNLQIDNLDYTYKTDSNVLENVKDNSMCLNGFKDGNINLEIKDFEYDVNGDLIIDRNKGIERIDYNHLHLPTVIYFENHAEIRYLYNANGIKLKKIVKEVEQEGETVTDYLDGYQYKNERLLFFPTAEGYVDFNGGKMFYVYNYTDHLGYVRVSYGINPSGNGQLKIIEENNYYPFGLKHENYNTEKYDYKKSDNGYLYFFINVQKKDYQYKFNGKELQDELGMNIYDYGARNYDPAIGRWMNIDPLAETSRRFSPYTYALNNPIYFIDPDGMEGEGFSGGGLDTSTIAGFSEHLANGGGPLGESKTGDYFSSKGEFMGSDIKKSNKIYIVQNTKAAEAGLEPEYGPMNVPEGFYKKDGSVDAKVGMAKSKDLAEMGGIENVANREKAAGGILNYYYKIAGYDLNELKDGNISNLGAEGGVARTRLGGVTSDSDYLGKGGKEIAVSFSSVGVQLQNRSDILNMFSHERGQHMLDEMTFGKKLFDMNYEQRAFNHQVNHSSWNTISEAWYNHIKTNGVFNKSDRAKFFKS